MTIQHFFNRILFRRVSPTLHRELAGLEFDHPIALEPVAVYNRGKYGVGVGRYSFLEIGPYDNRQIDSSFRRPVDTMVAANITQFHSTSTEDMVRDIVSAFSMLYDFADIFVVDTFRPSPDGTCVLQSIDSLSEVLDHLLENRRFYDDTKPLLIRVVPSIPERTLSDLLHYMRMSGVDGIIAGYDEYCPELVQRIMAYTKGRYPIIACGGINTYAKAEEVLNLGANMIQVQRIGASVILKTMLHDQKKDNATHKTIPSNVTPDLIGGLNTKQK